MLTLSGMLDVFRIATGQYKQRIYGPEEIAFAEAVNITVPAPCRILSAPVHNHAITLAGAAAFYAAIRDISGHMALIFRAAPTI